jgi:hypothetical protein
MERSGQLPSSIWSPSICISSTAILLKTITTFAIYVPSIEETWIMKRWALRVFQFMLAVSEVNIYLGLHHFVEESDENMSLLRFQCTLAWALSHNPLVTREEEAI